MKKKNTIKESTGITLVALIVTVIIMLILAGIAINLSIGENGIFRKSEEGANQYEEMAKKEQNDLIQVEEYLKGQITPNEELPDNTPQTEAGTEVKPLEEWYSTTSAYISTEDGSIVKKMTKVATVTAIATGNGEMVPVPNGFYYVGGTLATGVVISDNEADKNKYVNFTPTEEVKEGIPSGVAYNEDGTVNAEQSELKGNQFVWVPVSANEYVKKDFRKSKCNLGNYNEWN